MEVSLFLAKAWGVLLLIIGAGFLLDDKKDVKQFLRDVSKKGSLRLSGMISLILGIVTVLLHNVWTNDWRAIVTLFGWIAAVKGVVRLFNPGLVVKLFKAAKIEKWYSLWAMVSLVLGGYLAYVGFGLG